MKTYTKENGQDEYLYHDSVFEEWDGKEAFEARVSSGYNFIQGRSNQGLVSELTVTSSIDCEIDVHKLVTMSPAREHILKMYTDEELRAELEARR